MQYFNIATESGLNITEGRRITIAGVKCFISEEYGLYDISHLETGMLICADQPSRAEAIKVATTRLESEPEAIERGREVIRKMGLELPINKL